MSAKIGFVILGLLLLLVLFLGGAISSTYNTLVRLDQATQAQWAQVENVYQRRADLIPNLVETVKGASNFETETLTAITEARAKVGQVTSGAIQNIANDPAAFQRFQQAQDGLSSALSRLMVVVERYPELKANQNFRDLQAQLEGTENRVTVERMRFNTERFRSGDFTEGLVRGIKAIGTELCRHFPVATTTNVNELPNEVDFGFRTTHPS